MWQKQDLMFRLYWSSEVVRSALSKVHHTFLVYLVTSVELSQFDNNLKSGLAWRKPPYVAAFGRDKRAGLSQAFVVGVC